MTTTFMLVGGIAAVFVFTLVVRVLKGPSSTKPVGLGIANPTNNHHPKDKAIQGDGA